MSASGDRVPVTGTWYRHVRSGRDPTDTGGAGAGRWQRSAHVGAVYLADSLDTAWAEFYRACAEAAVPPARLLPRDLWTLDVNLAAVADLTDPARLAALGLPASEPTSQQWPAYQRVGEALADDGADAILYRSAAIPARTCLCVFAHAAAAGGMRAVERVAVGEPPAPPRGMRT